VYTQAARRYRVTTGRLKQLQDALDQYLGTHNFHNYTEKVFFKDPSAKRHIKSFVVNPEPILIGETEWLSLKVHGQSFMMHQIRKMVSLACLVTRCGAPVSVIRDTFGSDRIAIPKAPSIGLLLERPVFDNYNSRAVGALGRDEINFDKHADRMEPFKHQHIYKTIFEIEEAKAT
jgi:tRNA pseudouridine38-40 synthase